MASSSPFQPLSPTQSIADTLTECTQVIIALELLTSTKASTLVDLFKNAADEYNFGQNIASVGLATVTQAVESTTRTARSKKASWEDEALSAESLTAAASAAQLAAAVFGWAPGVNLCIDAAAIAAYVAAQVLEREAESAGNDVISYISNFHGEVLAQPGMNDLNQWNTAIQNNTLNFKKLGLVADDTTIHATLMAMTNYLLGQQLALTAENYGQILHDVGTSLANNPGLDKAWNNAVIALQNSSTAQDVDIQKNGLNAKFPGTVTATNLMLNISTGVMTLFDARAYAKIREVYKFNIRDLGNRAQATEVTERNPDVQRLTNWASRIRFLGGIVNVAAIVMSIFAIIDTAKMAGQMDDAIGKAHDGVLTNLTQLVNDESTQQAAENG